MLGYPKNTSFHHQHVNVITITKILEKILKIRFITIIGYLYENHLHVKIKTRANNTHFFVFIVFGKYLLGSLFSSICEEHDDLVAIGSGNIILLKIHIYANYPP